MSLDGLRAWIGEVERKLGMRTRVFLALSVIAIGIGGAAIYLAIDARESSVSQDDVQALQRQLEAQIGAGGGEAAGSGSAQLEAELQALKAQVEELKAEGGSGTGKKGGASGPSPSEEGKSTSGGDKGAGGASEAGGAAGTSGGSKARLGELIQQAKEASEAAEGK